MHLVSLKQAAALIHCHPYSLYSAIYQGRVTAVKLRGNLKIPASEVERLMLGKERLQGKLSVREAAQILTCSQSTVLRCIHSRELKAERIKGRYRINPEDLEKYVLSLPRI